MSHVLLTDKLISRFQKKADLFNNHFSSQCGPVKYASKLPNFNYKTDKRLISFDVIEDDILLIK